jgi:hypothetical protein
MFEDLKPQEREQMTTLLKQAGSPNYTEALVAQKAIAGALVTPLRQGIIYGDIIANIFTPTVFDPAARIEYPIDFFRPDNAGQFAAFVVPNQGKIPQRHVEGDYVTVPTYDIGAGIDYLLRYAREARWDIVGRAMEVLEAGFTKKKNDDGWHTLLTAGFDRNIMVSDSNGTQGQFTKRFISLMKLVMRRNAGGNSTSINRGKLTHLFLSPEAKEDIRNWGIDQADEFTRREIFLAADGTFDKVYDVALVDIDELGTTQEYEDYYENTVAVLASNKGVASGKLEICVGLDLQKQDSFVMPIREELQVFEDESLHKERRQGWYAWASLGFACLNNSRILLGSI